MRSWNEALVEGAVAGGLAAALSSAVVAITGKRDSGSAIAPFNAVSHWLWGDEAAQDESLSWRLTGVGTLSHVLSAAFWATLHAKVRPRVPPDQSAAAAMAGGVATSAVAAFVDYKLMPRRVTPGFENRLSTTSMVAAFGAIAAGVALGAILMDKARRR
jgi:hypothetical protein